MNRDLQSAGLTSVIVPCWGQLEFTRQCIAALKSHTRRPWELIVVDNGSTDGTADYLAGVSDVASVPVTVITNATNRGFPAAINQGLRAARGDYLVLLNNDVVVTDGWLGQLIGLADMRDRGTAEGADCAGTGRLPDDGTVIGCAGTTPPQSASDVIGRALFTPPGPPFKGGVSGCDRGVGGVPARRPVGLVGPMSNYAAPPQLVEGVPYRDMHEMHAFARRWRDEHRGRWFTAHKLSGFCLLMKRAVYEKIGGLDERFGLGFFDDDDLAERARREGFELAVARDLFVHHFGSRTFHGNGVDAGRLLDENARRFAAKWGLKEASGKPVMLRPWQGAGDGVLAPREPAARQRTETSHTLTGSAGAGVREPPFDPPPVNNPSPTRSASEGLRESLAESDGPLDGASAELGLLAETLAGACVEAGATAGPLAGASGWGKTSVYGTLALAGACVEPSPSAGPLAGASGWGDESPAVAHATASVSLTMIVRNEEDHLAKCLGSVRGLFDEIIIVDTGSVDRTKEIAREFGAKVFDFVWIDDFGAARNEALSHATCDYAFWLDADDVVEPVQKEKLRALFGRLKRPSRRGLTGARPPATPSAPLTRPAGDRSPWGRGDRECAGEAQETPLTAALPAPLTRPAGDLSPWGRGDDHLPGAGHAPAPALGGGFPSPATEAPALGVGLSTTTTERPPATLPAPLTRPAGDRSPWGRGDRECAGEAQETPLTAALPAPLTRPAGDLSPRGRGDEHRPGAGHAPAPAPGAGLPTPPTERPRVSQLAAGPCPQENAPFAYVMRWACPPGPDGARGGTVVDHVRLFPIWPGVRWTYRVHEQILPSLNRAKIKVRWTDVVIRHDGYVDPAVEARKLDRNIKILERELIEWPDEPFVLFNMGASAVQRKEYHAALGLLERSLALSAPTDSIVRKLYALIARVYQMTGNSQDALRTCAAGLQLDPRDAELCRPATLLRVTGSRGSGFSGIPGATGLQAACTPDFYVFDKDQDLVYRGQLDSSRPGNPMPVTGKDLRSALDAVLAGKAVSDDQRPSIGCNIKWKRGNEPKYS